MVGTSQGGARGDEVLITTGIVWAPLPDGAAAPGRNDRDGDGVPDSLDACPDEPEDKDGFQDEDGCPDLDNDGDGIPDHEDQCPNDPEDKDGFQDTDGCPEHDNDSDGIPDSLDRCPNEAEDKDGFEDDDGCPDPDNDGDGIPDKDDKCPNDPETVNGFEDEDGCPDVRATAGPEERSDRIDLRGNRSCSTARTSSPPRPRHCSCRSPRSSSRGSSRSASRCTPRSGPARDARAARPEGAGTPAVASRGPDRVGAPLQLDIAERRHARLSGRLPGGVHTAVTYILWVTPTGAVASALHLDGAAYSQSTAPNLVQVGTWHRLAATYDGTVHAIYVDRVAVAAKAASGAITPDSAAGLRIGSNSPDALNQNSDPFIGAIDSLRVWHRVLAASEL